MRDFLDYFSSYWRRSSRVAFLLTVAFLTILVAVNYTVGIEGRIKNIGPWWMEYAAFAVFYGGVIAVAWRIAGARWSTDRGSTDRGSSDRGSSDRGSSDRGWWRVLALAPFYFAAKMVHWDLSALAPGDAASAVNRYWDIVLQWPGKLVLLLGMLWWCWGRGWLDTRAGFGQSLGLTTAGFNARPYFFLLLLLAPLVALASTQPDFLRVYPKVKTVAFMGGYPWKIVYELAYGLDFLSIELFFRGLLVIGIIRYAGEKAILPMACFYCTIHFGKPLGECMTSFVGGMALGVLAYRTRSVLGGLIVHLGLAWMMEIGGWLGHLLRS